MKCNNCGHELEPGSGFCENCGMILSLGDDDFDGAPEEVILPEIEQPQVSKKRQSVYKPIEVFSDRSDFSEIPFQGDEEQVVPVVEEEPIPEAETISETEADSGAVLEAAEIGAESNGFYNSSSQETEPVRTASEPDDFSELENDGFDDSSAYTESITDEEEEDDEDDREDVGEAEEDDGPDSEDFYVSSSKTKKNSIIIAVLIVILAVVIAGGVKMVNNNMTVPVDKPQSTSEKAEKPTAEPTEKKTEKETSGETAPKETTSEKEITTEKETTVEKTTAEIIVTEPITEKPTAKPTEKETAKPTQKPTERETVKPTQKPAVKPTEKATAKPAEKPTEKVTVKPTQKPAVKPTEKATAKPAEKPTEKVTVKPTQKPAAKPETKPATTADPFGFGTAKVQKPDALLDSQSRYKTYVNVDSLTLRNIPKTEGERIVYLSLGESLTVLSKKNGGFIYVRSDRFGVYGWVDSQYVSKKLAEAETEADIPGLVQPDKTYKNPKPMMVGTDEGIRLRKAPKENASSVKSLTYRYPVSVIGYSGKNPEWVFIKDTVNGVSGWTRLEWLAKRK